MCRFFRAVFRGKSGSVLVVQSKRFLRRLGARVVRGEVEFDWEAMDKPVQVCVI